MRRMVENKATVHVLGDLLMNTRTNFIYMPTSLATLSRDLTVEGVGILYREYLIIASYTHCYENEPLLLLSPCKALSSSSFELGKCCVTISCVSSVILNSPPYFQIGLMAEVIYPDWKWQNVHVFRLRTAITKMDPCSILSCGITRMLQSRSLRINAHGSNTASLYDVFLLSTAVPSLCAIFQRRHLER